MSIYIKRLFGKDNRDDSGRDRIVEVKERIFKTLKVLVDIQCRNGKWNFSPYMLGGANGMILMLATLEGKDPEFLHSPEKWLSDQPYGKASRRGRG
jgi:hypothetical protein